MIKGKRYDIYGLWSHSAGDNWQCEHLIAWRTINSRHIAGALIGRSSVDVYYTETFVAKWHDRELAELWIRDTEHIRGIAYYEGSSLKLTSTRMRKACANATKLIWTYNDQAIWWKRDEVLLMPRHVSSLFRVGESGTIKTKSFPWFKFVFQCARQTSDLINST